jgi:hypothetical protein
MTHGARSFGLVSGLASLGDAQKSPDEDNGSK